MRPKLVNAVAVDGLYVQVRRGKGLRGLNQFQTGLYLHLTQVGVSWC